VCREGRPPGVAQIALFQHIDPERQIAVLKVGASPRHRQRRQRLGAHDDEIQVRIASGAAADARAEGTDLAPWHMAG
jgi:hypothetical protein